MDAFFIKRSWKKLSGLFRSIPCVCWAHIGLLCILESVKLHSSHLWLTFYFDPSPRGSGSRLTFQTQVGVNQVAIYQVTWQGELNMKKGYERCFAASIFSHPKWSDDSFSSHFRIKLTPFFRINLVLLSWSSLTDPWIWKKQHEETICHETNSLGSFYKFKHHQF